jgi:hypothetical protein
MIQTHENRVNALKSVLPLLDLHLDLICRVRSALGGAWESEPSPLDQPPKPKLITPDLFCVAQCLGCDDAVHCKDEAWVRQAQMLRWAYRLDLVGDSLAKLAGMRLWGHLWAEAVYWQYIELWTSWNPDKRREWSDRGLDYMAWDIPGDLFPFHMGDRQTGKLTRNEEIVRLREAGMSFYTIAKTVGCSKTTVAAILHGKGVRSGRMKSAGEG